MPVPLRTERDFGRSVKSVHSPVRAFINDGQGGIGCTVQGSAEGLGLLALGLADDPVDHLVIRVIGHPHTHLDAGKDIGAQVLNDVLQPVVTAGGAAFADTQLAHRQGHVVGDDQHMVGGYLVNRAASPTDSPERFI